MQDDIDRIMEVMDAAFDPLHGEAWNRRQVGEALLIGNCRYLIAGPHTFPPGPGEETAGFAMSRRVLDEEELLLLAVKPEWRSQGIGRLLLTAMTKNARAAGITKLFLEMREGNPAEALYRSLGFEQIGRRPDYYRRSDGAVVDALTFGLSI